MGTDSFMEMLRSDLNGLSVGNTIVIDRVYADLDGWCEWAMDTIAKHAPDVEAQVMSSTIARMRLNGDLVVWRKILQDPIYTNQGFTEVGNRLYDGYVKIVRDTLELYTARHLKAQRRQYMRAMLAQKRTVQNGG